MKERERESGRGRQRAHRQYAVFKPGIISCISQVQKEMVERIEVEYSQRPEASHKYIC